MRNWRRKFRRNVVRATRAGIQRYETRKASAKPWNEVPEREPQVDRSQCARKSWPGLTMAFKCLSCGSTPELTDVAPFREAATQTFTKNAPRKIYLQWWGADRDELTDEEFNEPVDPVDGEVTWCRDKINDTDLEYVLADSSALREAATPPYWTLKLLSDLFENCDLGNTLDARREFIDKATPIVEKHFGRLADSSAPKEK